MVRQKPPLVFVSSQSKMLTFFIKKSPGLVTGLEVFILRMQGYLSHSSKKNTGIMQISYNSYLNTAVELGIIGVTFLLLNFIIQWRYSFFLSDEYRYLIQILLVSMVVGCFANPWLSDTLQNCIYMLYSWLLVFQKKIESCN